MPAAEACEGEEGEGEGGEERLQDWGVASRDGEGEEDALITVTVDEEGEGEGVLIGLSMAG